MRRPKISGFFFAAKRPPWNRTHFSVYLSGKFPLVPQEVDSHSSVKAGIRARGALKSWYSPEPCKPLPSQPQGTTPTPRTHLQSIGYFPSDAL